MASPGFINEGAATEALASTSIVVPLPPSIVAGNTLLVYVSCAPDSGSSTFSISDSSYTQVGQSGHTLLRGSLFYKRAESSLEVNPTVTADGGVSVDIVGRSFQLGGPSIVRATADAVQTASSVASFPAQAINNDATAIWIVGTNGNFTLFGPPPGTAISNFLTSNSNLFTAAWQSNFALPATEIPADSIIITPARSNIKITIAVESSFEGSINVTEQNDVSSASGQLAFSGSSTITEEDDSVSASALLVFQGSSSANEENDVATLFFGTQEFSGQISSIEADDQGSGAASLIFQGTISQTEENDIAGTVPEITIFNSQQAFAITIGVNSSQVFTL